jgi:pyruvate dehydrogenase (quinone)
MMGSLSGNLATMCPGVPYAIAAKFAYPERPAIALIGDGAMQMLGINGLITVSKWWKTWSNPQLVILVLNNGDLNQVTWEQRVLSGNPKFEASQDLPAFPYASYAESLGLIGIKVDKPEDIVAGWQTALYADRPVVYEAVVDASVPTIPPHITFDQMVKFSKTLIKGDPDEVEVIRKTFRDVMKEVTH